MRTLIQFLYVFIVLLVECLEASARYIYWRTVLLYWEARAALWIRWRI
jgi:hypothetical protein